MRIPQDHDRRSKKRLREGSDPELGLLYYLFHVHHWTPEQYMEMNPGGRDLAWALASFESEEMEELAQIRRR